MKLLSLILLAATLISCASNQRNPASTAETKDANRGVYTDYNSNR